MMKNHFKKDIECDYSFDMLYQAAFGEIMSKKQKHTFQKLNQEKINELVLHWAKQAQWHTQVRKGDDGLKYIAFWK